MLKYKNLITDKVKVNDIEDELQNKRKAGARAEVAPLVTLMSAFDGALQVNFVTAHAPLTFPLHKYKMKIQNTRIKNMKLNTNKSKITLSLHMLLLPFHCTNTK